MTVIDARLTGVEVAERLQVEAAPCWIALTPGVDVVAMANGDLRITWPGGAFTFHGLPEGVREAIARLSGAGAPDNALVALVERLDGPEYLSRFYYHLNQLTGRGLLTYTARAGNSALLSVQGMTPAFFFRYRPIEQDARFVLSRFAYMRREKDQLLIETPLQPAFATGHSPLAGAIFARLATPASAAALASEIPGLACSEALAVLQLLLNLDAVERLDATGVMTGDRTAALAQWSFHDLLFHSRSRFGRHNHLFGATFRHLDAFDPLPATRPARDGERTALPRPDLEALKARDRGLTDAIESRVSVRSYGAEPITLDQLGEFLYRVARVRTLGIYPVPRNSGTGSVPMEVTSRPYPSGGASYELEFYVVVDRCAGLASGLYHYDPVHHHLIQVRPRDELVAQMLWYAGISAPGAEPQVMVSLAARFQRVTWKYDAIAYATIQKHVGVVYQTMYLVATAMGLGGCALGSGDADLFARAAGTDYLVESSVGDFMLGSLPDRDPASVANEANT